MDHRKRIQTITVINTSSSSISGDSIGAATATTAVGGGSSISGNINGDECTYHGKRKLNKCLFSLFREIFSFGIVLVRLLRMCACVCACYTIRMQKKHNNNSNSSNNIQHTTRRDTIFHVLVFVGERIQCTEIFTVQANLHAKIVVGAEFICKISPKNHFKSINFD